MNQNFIDMKQVKNAYQNLLASFKTVLIATTSRDGKPEASYSAYIKYRGHYYIYISELAAHTRNMIETAQAGLLFIENEDKASHLFARQRVSFQCEVIEIERESTDFDFIMDLFEDKFGNFISMLRDLQDFHLFKLVPQKGNFVQGFARAFTIDGEAMDNFHHVKDVGHKRHSDQSQNSLSRARK